MPPGSPSAGVVDESTQDSQISWVVAVLMAARLPEQAGKTSPAQVASCARTRRCRRSGDTVREVNKFPETDQGVDQSWQTVGATTRCHHLLLRDREQLGTPEGRYSRS